MNAMKQRWKNCETIGQHLGVHKSNVHQYLYTDIVDQNLLDRALKGEANEEIKQLPQWNGWRVVSEDNPPRRTDKVITPVEKLRLALWFIGKFESAEEALSAVQAAVKSLKGLI